MIRCRLRRGTLGAVVVRGSLAHEGLGALLRVRESPGSFQVRSTGLEALHRDPGVRLVSSLITAGYQPDFLTPTPTRAPWTRTAFGEQLRTIASTSDRDVAEQLDRWRPGAGPRELAVVDAATAAAPLAPLAARGLAVIVRALLGPTLPVLYAQLARRSDLLGRGLAAAGTSRSMDELHADLHCQGETLLIDKPYDETATLAGTQLTLIPVVHGDNGLRVQICTGQAASIAFPAGVPEPSAGRVRDPRPALGGSRLRVLSALLPTATTTQIAAETGLAPSTVSYHLNVLERAGLTERSRHGGTVQYRVTQLGRELRGE
jgi:DNA-binding transcriptional ArsR family regulator